MKSSRANTAVDAAVEHAVMDGHDEQMPLRGETQQGTAPQRAAAQVEGLGRHRRHQPDRIRVAHLRRFARRRRAARPDWRRRRNHLDERLAAHRIGGAQRLVPPRDFGEAPVEHVGIECSLHPKGQRDVIGRIARFPLIDEPRTRCCPNDSTGAVVPDRRF